MADNTIAPRNIFSFFGPPGSGKGTLAQQCAKTWGAAVLSTGDLCRKHIAESTEFGKSLEGYLKTGQLIPDNLITDIVTDWLSNKLIVKKDIILDGYPRTGRQVESFFGFLKQQHDFSIKFRVIVFDISAEEVVRRLSSRLVCSNKECQTIYSLTSKPPVVEQECDLCQSSLEQRADDHPHVIRQRLEVFASHKSDVLDSYRRMGHEVHALRVDGKTPEDVFNDFAALIGMRASDK